MLKTKNKLSLITKVTWIIILRVNTHKQPYERLSKQAPAPPSVDFFGHNSLNSLDKVVTTAAPSITRTIPRVPPALPTRLNSPAKRICFLSPRRRVGTLRAREGSSFLPQLQE